MFFLKKKALILLKTTDLNYYAIKLQENQQPSYKLVYSLALVKLEMLKTFIKTNLSNSFIQPSKFLVDAFILFVKKVEGSFYLYVNY